MRPVKLLHDWCASVVGPCEVVSGDRRFHGRSSVWRVLAPSSRYYVKVHREHSQLDREAHFLEHWAGAFGALAPRLIGVHDTGPFALLLSELPGQPMEAVRLSQEQERAVWRAAGCALAELHGLVEGDHFGPCGRDGVCVGPFTDDAVEYIDRELDEQVARAARAGLLSQDELAIARAAQALVGAFSDERPVPCHRDYNPANWLISPQGVLAGVIDFEMGGWDVRVADFSRYPNWEWMHKPDVLDAFTEGYGHLLTPCVEQQRLVARIQYALGAIIWGSERMYLTFEEEGRQALRALGHLLA